ncbi:Peptide transport system permease protein sapC (TC 3.A.1.5.5) [Azospirillum argentinense]|uniref:SapC family protein n=1 Tax=Azospirillum TaxID=191 RepID=UPI000E0C2D4C|nr:SapC family protein [Azospirillum brasilense]
MTEPSPASSEPQGIAMPLFYNRVFSLDPARDQGLRLASTPNAAFARQTSLIPLLASEFSAALADYPIVFTSGAAVDAVAIVGIKADENLFVDAAGRWKAGCYVPAYARRYPFILIDLADGDTAALGYDPDSALIGPDQEVPLFDGAQPSDAARQALNFCATYRNEARTSASFVKAIVEAGVLTEKAAQISLDGGAQARAEGFQVVDEEKLRALPDDTLLDWQRKGWLALIHAHLFSLQRWPGLVARSRA